MLVSSFFTEEKRRIKSHPRVKFGEGGSRQKETKGLDLGSEELIFLSGRIIQTFSHFFSLTDLPPKS